MALFQGPEDEDLEAAPYGLVKTTTAKRTKITPEESLQTWASDHWMCRYCGDFVFFPPALRALSRRFGNYGYYHPNWKGTILIKQGASVDHVQAITRGGPHCASNFVTACWDCNLSKGNSIEWDPIPSNSNDSAWDGLLAVFKGIAISNPDRSEREWLRAIQTVGL